MTVRCSYCGQSIASFDVKALSAKIGLSNIQARVLECISKAEGEWIDAIAIGARVYADDPDGGPEFITPSIYQHVSRIREKLNGYGLTIEGRQHCGYRLVSSHPMERAA